MHIAKKKAKEITTVWARLCTKNAITTRLIAKMEKPRQSLKVQRRLSNKALRYATAARYFVAP